MKFDDTTRAYLDGSRFSNGHHFALGNAGRALRRGDRLVQLVQGRRVLHVGCCDHLDLIRDKVAQGIYLHQQLCRSAQQCVGVDTNAAGIALLRELGFEQSYVPGEVPEQGFDICLLADVIEHVGDVVAFLREMRRYAFGEIIVVTPNLFRLRNFLSRGEVVNTDHRYWFSPYTLCKVLVDAGYTPTSVELLHSDHLSWKGALQARVLDAFPKYRDTLLVRARP
jgi:2-polyprenyl-3-methyl-5-hydroxy-6-metoxy-1,4-benzoquinol methylase